MLSDEDEQWLRGAYPRLVVSADGVSGSIEFKATYNSQHNLFLILADGVINSVGGLTLSGEFRISIKEKMNKTFSALPAVYVEEIEATQNRHFDQRDKSACLCSPYEENEFLQPSFQFRLFLEKLVIPFLYAQIFYSEQQRWPWAEYTHLAAGLLEAYSEIADPSRAEECLQKLKHYSDVWPRIKAALQQKPYIKGHTPCFCLKMDHMRRCHPHALRGAQQLQRDIRALALPLALD